jgi:alternate signal-mediated exported protein
MNNKMIKGSIAGATGIVLLMGGFGTYALWSDSVQADGGVLGSGALKITGVGDGSWTETSTGSAQAWDNASDLMVPGDVVVLDQPLDVKAVGKNLRVKLTVDGVDNDFAAPSLSMKVEFGGETETFTGPGPYVIDYDTVAKVAALNGDPDGAVVTFTFEDVDDTTDQDTSVDLSNVTLTLDQVRP